MAVIVQKFGGTSVADIERIHNVARKVKMEWDRGHQLVVVVSAMSGVTNGLIEKIEMANPVYDSQEYDAVVASGEQVTSGLLALILQKMGMPARSFMGWQIPFVTDGNHGKASIENISADRLLDGRRIAVCAGFQGVSPAGRITTLGRGGSDTSAVAIAAVLKAERCDIYTDVDGVYTTDPRIVSKACKIARLSYEEMLEMASQGAKVLQTRSVEMARHFNVSLRVLSSFEDDITDDSGSWIGGEDKKMEQRDVTGIACSRGEAQINLLGIDNAQGATAKVFSALAEKNIVVDMIVQVESKTEGRANLAFTIGQSDVDRVVKLLEDNKEAFRFTTISVQAELVKISIIGSGMRTHSGIASKLFKELASRNIHIYLVSTSEIKVSVVIDQEYTEFVMRNLHQAYHLDQ